MNPIRFIARTFSGCNHQGQKELMRRSANISPVTFVRRTYCQFGPFSYPSDDPPEYYTKHQCITRCGNCCRIVEFISPIMDYSHDWDPQTRLEPLSVRIAEVIPYVMVGLIAFIIIGTFVIGIVTTVRKIRGFVQNHRTITE